MKIKPSTLENLIKEEMKIFFENHGAFPIANEVNPGVQGQQEGDMNEMKSDLKLIYMRLLEHLGGEKLLEEIVKNTNPRVLRETLDSIAKLYSVRVQ